MMYEIFVKGEKERYMKYEEAKKITNDRPEILRLLFEGADQETYKRIVNTICNNMFLINYEDDLYLFQPINAISKDGWKSKAICSESLNNAYRNERLVALNEYNVQTNQFTRLHPQIFVDPVYFKVGRKGTFPQIYVREGVLESLLEHLDLLPSGYGVMVYDGFRTFDCQKDIYDEIYVKKVNEERKIHPERTIEEIEEYVKKEIMPNYVSFPSFDPPSTHNTGGAIDFRLCDQNGMVLNYGCEFDEFESIANVDYFDKKLKAGDYLTDSEIEAMLIRRVSTNLFSYPTTNILYHYVGAKRQNSFVAFTGEDWHMDINNLWDMELRKAIYGSCERDGVVPDPDYTIKTYIKERRKIIGNKG